MKGFTMCAALLAIAIPVVAQQKPAASPPEQATATVHGSTITIKYSSPRVRGRAGHIFGSDGLLSHDKHYPVWRAGANSATSLHSDADLTIGDLSVPRGDYTLFVDVSNPDQWTLIVNKQTGEWGLAYNASDDLGKVPMHMSKPPQTVEDLRWEIRQEGGDRGRITLAWEDHSASVPVTVH